MESTEAPTEVGRTLAEGLAEPSDQFNALNSSMLIDSNNISLKNTVNMNLTRLPIVDYDSDDSTKEAEKPSQQQQVQTSSEVILAKTVQETAQHSMKVQITTLNNIESTQSVPLDCPPPCSTFQITKSDSSVPNSSQEESKATSCGTLEAELDNMLAEPEEKTTTKSVNIEQLESSMEMVRLTPPPVVELMDTRTSMTTTTTTTNTDSIIVPSKDIKMAADSKDETNVVYNNVNAHTNQTSNSQANTEGAEPMTSPKFASKFISSKTSTSETSTVTSSINFSSASSETIQSSLFKEVRFSICDDVQDVDKVKSALISAGAKFLNYLGDTATHLIADNPDHSYVTEAVDIYEKPVVTSQWVWLSLRANNILPLSPFLPSSLGERLFSRFVFCPSQLGLLDTGRIWSMVTFYGGSFQLRFDKTVTHLITGKITGKKYDAAARRGGDTVKVVTPDWVLDCVRQRKLCDAERYHPRLLVTYNQQYANKLTTEDGRTAKGKRTDASNGGNTNDLLALPKATKSSVTMAISTDTVSRKADGAPKEKSTSSSTFGGKAQILQSPSAAAKFFHPPTPPPGSGNGEIDGGIGDSIPPPKGPGRPKGSLNVAGTKAKAPRRRTSTNNVKATKSAPTGAPKGQQQQHPANSKQFIATAGGNADKSAQPPNKVQQMPPNAAQKQSVQHHLPKEQQQLPPQFAEQNIVGIDNKIKYQQQQQQQQAKSMSNEQMTPQSFMHKQQMLQLPQQQQLAKMSQQQQQPQQYQEQQQAQYQVQTGSGKPRAYLQHQQQQQQLPQQQQQQQMFIQQPGGGVLQQFQTGLQQPQQQQQPGMVRQMIPVGMQQQAQSQRVMTPGPQHQPQMIMQQQQQQQQQAMQGMQPRMRQTVPYNQQQQSQQVQMMSQAGPGGQPQMIQFVRHPSQMFQQQQQHPTQRMMVPMNQQQQQQQQVMVQNQQYQQQQTGEVQMQAQQHPQPQQQQQFMQRMPVNMLRVAVPMEQAKMMQQNQQQVQQQPPYSQGIRMRGPGPQQVASQQQQVQMMANGPQRMMIRQANMPVGMQSSVQQGPQQQQASSQGQMVAVQYQMQQQQQMRPAGKPMQYMRTAQPGIQQQQQQRWQGPGGQAMIVQEGQQPMMQQNQQHIQIQSQQQQQQQQFIQIQRQVQPGQQQPQQQQIWVQQHGHGQMMQQQQQPQQQLGPQQQQFRLQQQQQQQQQPPPGARMSMQPGAQRMMMQQQQQQHPQDMNKVRLQTNSVATTGGAVIRNVVSNVQGEQQQQQVVQQQQQQHATQSQGTLPQQQQQLLPQLQQTATKIYVHASQGNGQNFQISLMPNNAGSTGKPATVMLATTTPTPQPQQQQQQPPQQENQSDVTGTGGGNALRPASTTCQIVNVNSTATSTSAASSVVGEKTKTALANLLNNRLNLQQNGQQQQQSPPGQGAVPRPQGPSSISISTATTAPGNVVQLVAKPPPAVASVVAGANQQQQQQQQQQQSQPQIVSDNSVDAGSMSLVHPSHALPNGKIPGVYGAGGMLPPQRMMMPNQMAQQGQPPPPGGNVHFVMRSVAHSPDPTTIGHNGSPLQKVHPSMFRVAAVPRPQHSLVGGNSAELMVAQHSSMSVSAAAAAAAGSIPPLGMIQSPQHILQIRFFGHDTKLTIPVEMCFFRCVFFIAPNYTENPKTASLVEGWKKKIVRHGGEVVEQYTPGHSNEVTHVVTENLTGLLSSQALSDNKRCVTIFWLDDVIRNERLLPPWRFYHLPVAFDPNHKPCISFIISITNFEGDDRSLLRYLIERTGARFTKYMSSRTTLLLCRKLGGKKYQKAKEWQIPTVNVAWLQDVLFGAQEPLQLNNLAAKYLKFYPNQVSLFNQANPNTPTNSANSAAQAQKLQKDIYKVDYNVIKPVMLSWQTPIKLKDDEVIAMKRKIDQEKGIQDNLSGIIDAVAQGKVGCDNGTNSDEEDVGKSNTTTTTTESTPIKTTLMAEGQMARSMGDAKLQLRFDGSQWSNQTTKRSIDTMTAVVEKGVGVSTPIKGALVYTKEESMDSQPPLVKRLRLEPSQESMIAETMEVDEIEPSGNTNFEKDLMPVIDDLLAQVEYQTFKTQQDARSLPAAMSIKIEQDESLEEIPITVAAAVSAATAASEETSSMDVSTAVLVNGDASKSSNDENNLSGNNTSDQLFKVPLATKSVDVLLTGFNVADQERYTAMVHRLGGRVVDTPAKCTHLVVPSNRFTPTIKFFIAFAHADHLLAASWLTESDNTGHFVPVAGAGEGEEQQQQQQHFPDDPNFMCLYGLSLREAFEMRNVKLFENIVFTITRSVLPSPTLLQPIIEAFGGVAIPKHLPSKSQLQHLTENEKKRFVLVTERHDFPLCEFLNDTSNFEIVSVHFLFESILSHELNFNKFNLRPQILSISKEVAITGAKRLLAKMAPTFAVPCAATAAATAAPAPSQQASIAPAHL